ncbi:MAG: Peptidase [Pseudomonadota bacterium]|jgi:serine protease Do
MEQTRISTAKAMKLSGSRAAQSLLAVCMALSLAVPVSSVAQSSPQTALSATVRGLPDFADLVEKVGPAVVNIRTIEKRDPNAAARSEAEDPMAEFFRRFVPRPGPMPSPNGPRGRGGGTPDEVPRGVGSGFVITADGFILTNHHVVNGADEIIVTMTDRREFKAKLIGSDERTDVALLKVEASGLPRLSFGDSNKLRVGEWVVAIGSPFGLDSTVTAGIVSAKGRETGEYLPFIQTDVAVNPGNSGGPLLNLRGEVVGINSMIYSRTGGFMGISFAIPIDEAQRVYEQLRSSGRVIRGRMGVGIAEVSKEVAEALGLPKAAGALVRNVERGSPAERAGLEAGDIILRYEGKPIERSSDLPRLVGGTKPGTKASLGIWRKGVAKDLVVVVAEAEPDRSARSSTPRAAPGAAPSNFLGLVVSELSDERRSQLRLRGGVQVDSADGAAARAGIQAGDLILSINNQEIANLAQFNEVVAKLDRNRAVVALVRRGDSAQFVPIRPGR